MNGDILDNATKTSIGDTYTQTYSPMEQLQRAVELFAPIKDKILCVTHGNHENRTYKKEGINLSSLIANQLNLEDRYTATSAVLFIRVGANSRGWHETNGSGKLRKICYTLYVLHGSGGGRKEGAKAIRLADMASIIDTDIYIHSHTHLPMIMKQGYHRIDPRNSTVAHVDKLFVNTAANLKYGGYGEAVYQEAVYSKKVLEYRLEQKLDVVGNELLYSDIVEFNNMLRREKIWSSNPWVGCLYNSKVASIDYIELPIEKGGE